MRGLSLIVPVYNAEKIIESSLMQYFNYFSGIFNPFEIIVVCNACTDKTEEICNSLSQKIPLKVLSTPERGKGYAITIGFEHSTYDIIGFLDADNPFNLSEIIKMISFLDLHDMVIVTKFRNFLKYQSSFTRRFFSISGMIVFRFLFGLNFKDTQAGAKFMTRDLLNLLEKPFICKGFEFDMELLYKAVKVNAKIKEYYIQPREANFSTVKIRILPGIMYRLLKLRFLK
jgi:glycosyltransferase involved in cell wall biosynthesis